MEETRVAGSFRDPDGHVFVRDGVLYRQINEPGRNDYDHLIESGLYTALVDSALLIPHDDLGLPPWAAPEAYTIITPRPVPMVSYPYEWCFSQLRDAALLTLSAARRALASGMSLKDASAYNVQFVDGRPVLIDTLSFERVSPGPWTAYRQFCQHFYAPLALIAHVEPRLGKISQAFIDGIPLRVASRALPMSTWLRPGPVMHLHLHALAEARLGHGTARRVARGSVMTDSKLPLIDSLEATIKRLRFVPDGAWLDYYDSRDSYTAEAIEQKVALVVSWLDRARPALVWDLGANTGRFSRLASERGIRTVAFDQDVACVEQMYLDVKNRSDRFLLPLVMDLTNPSPAIGWAHEERASLIQRGPADLVLALALVHHLALGNNVPLDRLAQFFKAVARHVIVEFVPKSDPMAAALIASRTGIFSDYTQQAFEAAFEQYFAIEQRVALVGSERVLYRMTTR